MGIAPLCMNCQITSEFKVLKPTELTRPDSRPYMTMSEFRFVRVHLRLTDPFQYQAH